MDQWKDQSINEWVDAISYHGDNDIGNRSSLILNRKGGEGRESSREEKEKERLGSLASSPIWC